MILAQTDHRLSFQLKLYESIGKEKNDAIELYMDTYRWINANVRNIMDESDAILQPNYQLIYTIGSQFPLDGGEHRWKVIQAVLKRVPHHMRQLYKDWNTDKKTNQALAATVEFNEKYVENGHIYGAVKNVQYRVDVFTPCRILDESVYDDLKLKLADDFLNGELEIIFPEEDKSTIDLMRKFLIDKKIDSQSFDKVRQQFLSRERELNTIYILRGLLRFEVLKLVLMKRWRVNYGVNANGQRKMAIPFKAKDVPAEMSEFGHPDIAICFTQLSYYYSGWAHLILVYPRLVIAFQILSLCLSVYISCRFDQR